MGLDQRLPAAVSVGVIINLWIFRKAQTKDLSRPTAEKKRNMIKFTSCHLIMKQISEQINQRKSPEVKEPQ